MRYTLAVKQVGVNFKKLSYMDWVMFGLLAFASVITTFIFIELGRLVYNKENKKK